MTPATKADFLRADVGAVLSGVEQTCWKFSGVLYARAEQATKAGDGELAWVLSLLSDVASYGLKADDWRQPYGPRMVFEGRRTASIEDGCGSFMSTSDGSSFDHLTSFSFGRRGASGLGTTRSA